MMSADMWCFTRTARDVEDTPSLGRADIRTDTRTDTDPEWCINSVSVDYTPIRDDLPLHDETSRALYFCRKEIVAPFKWFLKVVGWYPVLDVSSQLACVNCLYPTLVVLTIISGYVIQLSTCFARFATSDRWTGQWDSCDFNRTGPLALIERRGDYCGQHIISRFIVLIILHSAAYCYSFYSLRFAEPEHLSGLMERVFLYTTTLGGNMQEKGRCIRILRLILFSSLSCVLVLLIGDVIHMTCVYGQMCFTWLYPTDPGQKFLSVLLVFSFTLLNVVYVAVVANYSFQCRLLVFFTDGLIRRLRENSIRLYEAMEHVGVLWQEVSRLNKRSGVAVSLVIINFVLISILGVTTLLTTNYQGSLKILMYVNGVICLLVWLTLIVVPIVAAARLTSRCTHLRKLGMEVRLRSPAEQEEYQSAPLESSASSQDTATPSSPLEERQTPMKVDSFLCFMNAVDISATLFLLPVRSGYILIMLLIGAFACLFLFQMGVMHFWLI